VYPEWQVGQPSPGTLGHLTYILVTRYQTRGVERKIVLVRESRFLVVKQSSSHCAQIHPSHGTVPSTGQKCQGPAHPLKPSTWTTGRMTAQDVKSVNNPVQRKEKWLTSQFNFTRICFKRGWRVCFNVHFNQWSNLLFN